MKTKTIITAAAIAALALTACGGGEPRTLTDIANDIIAEAPRADTLVKLEKMGPVGVAVMLDHVADLYAEAADLDPQTFGQCAAAAHEAAAAVRIGGLIVLAGLDDTVSKKCGNAIKADAGG